MFFSLLRDRMRYIFFALLGVDSVLPDPHFPHPDGVGLSFPVLNIAADFSPVDDDVEGYVKRGLFFSQFKNQVRQETTNLASDSDLIKKLQDMERRALPSDPFRDPPPFSLLQSTPQSPVITVTLVDDDPQQEDSPNELLTRLNDAVVAHSRDFDTSIQILQVQVEKLQIFADLLAKNVHPSFLEMTGSADTAIDAARGAIQVANVARLISRVKKGGDMAYQAMSTLLGFTEDQNSMNTMKMMMLQTILERMLKDPKDRYHMTEEGKRLAGSLLVKLSGVPSTSVKVGYGGGFGEVTMVLFSPSPIMVPPKTRKK